MGVMIHLAYKTSTGGGVPSPVDGKTITTWPLDEWRELMPYLRAFGVTVPVCPPLTKGATLGAGYDPFDHYDLGSKNQSGRVETRYGSIETAGRFFSACQAQGMEVYVNVVDHHMDGDSGDEVYQYLGADGKTKNGRFPKDSHCFTSVWPNPDGVADSSTDWAFGREFLWNSGYYGDGKGSNGPGYVRHGLAAALDWQTRRLNVDGYFLDDVKGTNEDFVGYLLTYGAMNGKVSFGEYSDGQTGNVERWINSSGVHRTCGALDFPLKYKLNNVLNNAGNADIRQILSEGLLWNDPLLSVTFLDDADSDLTSPIIWNKLLGYAMILTFPGYPMLFGKDLYQQPGCYGLMVPVMNLVWIHETFAKGNIVWRWLDYNFLVYERMGDNTSSGLLAGVNNKMGDFKNPNDWMSVTVHCKWKNTQLHDYTGNSNDVWTDNNGNVTIWLPPNDNGRGYVVFAPTGVVNNIHLTPRMTTQIFFGADDLDIPAARNGVLTLGRIYVAKNSPLTAKALVYAGYSGNVVPEFLDPNGLAVSGNAKVEGFYTLVVNCSNCPTTGSEFEVSITYKGV